MYHSHQLKQTPPFDCSHLMISFLPISLHPLPTGQRTWTVRVMASTSSAASAWWVSTRKSLWEMVRWIGGGWGCTLGEREGTVRWERDEKSRDIRGEARMDIARLALLRLQVLLRQVKGKEGEGKGGARRRSAPLLGGGPLRQREAAATVVHCQSVTGTVTAA